jgi:NAD(P)-dependent dehydrogenase (short-subunit alcohol dehydrogenase family)
MATVLITGTSSGIGLATALELGRAGHKVYATMRNPARAPQLGEQVSVLTMDVDSDQSVADCFAGIYRQGVQIDVLVNNAGIERHGSIEELPMEDFRATMETNYFGALRCIRQVAPRMRERRSGCIVNVSSVAGKISASPLTAYSASKYALEALSEGLAGEMKPFGVRVAIVQPGIIETPMPHAIAIAPASKYPSRDAIRGLVPCLAPTACASIHRRHGHQKHHRKWNVETAAPRRARCRAVLGLESRHDRRAVGRFQCAGRRGFPAAREKRFRHGP